MSEYTAPVRDARFVLEHVTPLSQLNTLDVFAHAEFDLVDGLLAEAGRFASEAIAPTNREGDLAGAVLEDGKVRLPDSFGKVYDQFVAAGWPALQHPAEHGGGGFPLTVANALKEFVTSANMAFSLGPMLTTASVELLVRYGTAEQQQRYLQKLVSGEWTGTMCLTEPQAGSDLGAVTARAIPQDDGTYRLTGQKIFITYGDHDLADNIIHLVLARLPDAPPGTKGISVFLVPKFVLDADGQPGERNDVEVVSLEHKLGIHASPTCVLAFGEQGDGAVAELVGTAHQGMPAMFTMMNDARLGVGLQGLAIAERAYQQALAYALDRRQGRGPGTAPGTASPIVEHPDVRRMLLTQKAAIEALRALCSANAHAMDLARHAPDDDVRARHQKLADLLTPLSKAWGTDLGVEMTSLALQVHGGMGYVEETGVAQHFRDARIAPIYEGTNGIQAIDLVGRKLAMDDGGFVPSVLADLKAEVEALPDALQALSTPLLDALEAVDEVTRWLLEREDTRDVLAAATPYLRALATVVAGVLVARGAAAAHRRLEDGDLGAYDEDFLTAKIVVARFYAQQWLPQVHGLKPAITAGIDDLVALSPQQLAP